MNRWAVVITADRKRHRLPLPHEPNSTERVELPGYGLLECWWETEEDDGTQVYREHRRVE